MIILIIIIIISWSSKLFWSWSSSDVLSTSVLEVSISDHINLNHHHYHRDHHNQLLITINIIIVILRHVVNLCSGSAQFSKLQPLLTRLTLSHWHRYLLQQFASLFALYWPPLSSYNDKADTVTLAQVSFASFSCWPCHHYHLLLTRLIWSHWHRSLCSSS